jgi:hypothetical protein
MNPLSALALVFSSPRARGEDPEDAKMVMALTMADGEGGPGGAEDVDAIY